MWLRHGGLLAATMAVLSVAAVAFGAWFTLAHSGDWQALLDSLSSSGMGLATLAVVLLSGWLMAIAFQQAEEAVALFRKDSSADAEEEADRG
ncbi:MAG: hypothetical protein ACLFU7_04500 [Armatimonadota bacterium]